MNDTFLFIFMTQSTRLL